MKRTGNHFPEETDRLLIGPHRGDVLLLLVVHHRRFHGAAKEA